VQHPNKILNASRAYLLTSVMGSIRLEVLQQRQGAAQPPLGAMAAATAEQRLLLAV
jgi:hypothetical protein